MGRLRAALATQGVEPAQALLGSFYEDEEAHEYGVVICDDGRVFEFVRDTDASPDQFKTWRRVDDLEKAIDEYPQVAVALDMVAD